ncbi:protein kinase domain-containing protein [Nonomuraea sp. NPDC003214]
MDRQVGNRYRLIEPIGEGGMGVVWRAHDQLLDRTVAIKEVRYTGVGDAQRAALNRRTIREARAAGRLDHPSVIVVHDVVEEDGRPWIVMQLVRSRSLAETIRDGGPLPAARVAAIGARVLDALRAAHATGVLHRDVKPENVLLADGGRVVLTDFGIAAVETDAGLTATGGLVGTPAYMPPERLNGEAARPESDLWSLGATLYAAVEGAPPYRRDTWAATVAAILRDPLVPPAHAGPLAPVITGLLSRDPATRMPAAEAARLLESIAARPPHPGPVPGQPAGGAYPGVTPSPAGAPPHGGAPAYDGTPDHGGVPAYDGTPGQGGVLAHGGAPSQGGGSSQGGSPAPGGASSWSGAPLQGGGAGRGASHSGAPAQGGAWREETAGQHGGMPTGGVPGGDTVPVPQGRRWAGIGVAVVAAAALGAGGVLVALELRSPGTDVAAQATPTGASTGISADNPTGSPAGDPTGAPTSTPTGSSAEPTASASGEPTATGSARPPAGWRTYRNAAGGFSIALPRGWRAAKSPTRDSVTLSGPGTAGKMVVEWTVPEVRHSTPEAHWRALEREIRDKGEFPGYRRIGIRPLTYLGVPAADWEFVRPRDGDLLHVVNRGFRTADDRPFALYWETSHSRWERDKHYVEAFLRTFRPVPR